MASPSTEVPKDAHDAYDAALSDVLRDLGGRKSGVTLGEALDRIGTRAHGAAILILALPDALPLPVPSLSWILGGPLVVASAHLAVFGEGRSLPAQLRAIPIASSILSGTARLAAPALERLERLSRPRLTHLVRRERALGLACLYLSLILLLPLPLVNTPPSLCLSLIAWGMVRRDGAFVAAGLIGGLGLTIALGLAGFWIAAWWAARPV